MSDISKIILPNGNEYNLKDPTKLGKTETAYRSAAIYYGQVDSTSTSKVFTAQIPGITEYYDGLTILLKNGVVTSASGFTIDINGLGAKQAYSNMAAATAETTLFNVNYTMLFIYDSTRVTGGGWILYRGYNSNDNTIGYQIRLSSSSLPMDSVVYRYRLLFCNADCSKFIPANNSTSTNATSVRAVCQTPINPFGPIFYYSGTGSVAVNDHAAASTLWQQYAVNIGYSFNWTGAAATMTGWKPVYLKCTPQSDGTAIIDANIPYVQDLPITEDGKIYILLGIAYAAASFELILEHPVFCYKDGGIRLWTNTIPSDAHFMEVSATQPANQTAGDYWFVLEENLTSDYQQVVNAYGGNTAYISSSVQEE